MIERTLVALAREQAPGLALPYVIGGLLAAGAALRVGLLGLGFLRLRNLRTLPGIGPGWSGDLHAPMAEVGIAASLRVSDHTGPMHFGLRRPIIVLPASFPELDREAQRGVMLHESIHVRRHDWVTSLVEELSLAVLWFHPWCWWIRAQIRLAREEVVDREVVARLGSRDAYARCLLSVAGYPMSHSRGVALVRVRELRRRLDALFEEVFMSRRRLAATTAVFAAALAGTATAAASSFPIVSMAGAGSAQSDSPRRILQMVPPELPAGSDHVTGSVSMEVTVSPAGDVSGFAVTSGQESLRAPAAAAVRQWKFDRARTADVLIVDIGFERSVREGQAVRSWKFSLRRPGATPPLPAGGDVVAPRVTKEVHPTYPPEAKAAGLSGNVIVEAVVGVDGRVGDVNVVHSIPELDNAAIEAVQQWEFQPGTKSGVPVPVMVHIQITFTLK